MSSTGTGGGWLEKEKRTDKNNNQDYQKTQGNNRDSDPFNIRTIKETAKLTWRKKDLERLE